MTVIAPAPIFMNDATLSVATDDYAAACSSIKVVPVNTIVTFKGLKRTSVKKFAGNSEWTLEITLAQDLATATSLQNYLLTNQGQTKEFVFEPISGGKKVTVSAMIVPGEIGGDVETVATQTVSLGVDGAPVIS